MITRLLELKYMPPGVARKDLIYNDTINKLDNFTTISVQSAIDSVDNEVDTESKYLITQGSQRNSIAYYSTIVQDWLYLKPKEKMFIAVIDDCRFFTYQDGEWHPWISNKPSKINVIQWSEQIVLPTDRTSYLVLQGDCHISLQDTSFSEFTLLVAQSHEQRYAITWHSHIKEIPPHTYKEPSEGNIDLIKFFAVPDLGVIFKVIAQL